MRRFALLASVLLFVACGPSQLDDDDAGPPDAGPSGLAVLGNGSHDTDAVELTVLATADDGLSEPRDLEVSPDDPTQIWIVNHDTSMVVLFDYAASSRHAEWYGGFGTTHFLAEPSALAFGANGTFATAPEENEPTQSTTPADFMGPALWTTDPAIFDAGHASHIDMLHNSPSSAGIAWERDNVYWVFDGAHLSLTRYDFGADHGPGAEDHSDGLVERYVEGQLGYYVGVSSHLEMDRTTGLLYVADTGNNRIAVLDTATGERGEMIYPNYDGGEQYYVEGAELRTLVDGDAVDMERPSGLALHEGHVFVTDNATRRVVAFDLEGTLVDWLELGDSVSAGGLMGIAVEPGGALLLADAEGNRILRIAPLP